MNTGLLQKLRERIHMQKSKICKYPHGCGFRSGNIPIGLGTDPRYALSLFKTRL
jgi:hypothetical protein